MVINKIATLVGRGKGEDAEIEATDGQADEAFAQPVTLNRIALLMQEMGYRGKIAEGEDWCWVESATNGTKFNIYAFSDQLSDPDSEARSIQFDGGWGGLSSLDARRFVMLCNRFNHDWRYAKATISADRDRYSLTVKLDHYCPIGLTDDEFFAVADMYIRLIEDMGKRAFASSDEALNVMIQRHKTATTMMWSHDADPAKALAIFMANARAGYGPSMNSLGDVYECGIEVSRSAPMAAHFFTRAAERGHPSAYYGLARIFAETEQDEAILIEAAKFAMLAYRDLPEGQTKHNAGELRDRLMEKLGTDARELAERLVGTWAPMAFEGAPIDPEPVLDYVRTPPSSALN
jgi:hypothetical protein